MKTLIYTANYKAYDNYPNSGIISIVNRKHGAVIASVNKIEFGDEWAVEAAQVLISEIQYKHDTQ